MPPAAEHRDGRHGVDDLGDEHHRADLAGVAAGLGALGDDDVDAGLHVALGVHAPCRPARARGTPRVGGLDHVLRRRAEGVGHERGPVGERDSMSGTAPARPRQRPAAHPGRASSRRRRRRRPGTSYAARMSSTNCRCSSGISALRSASAEPPPSSSRCTWPGRAGRRRRACRRPRLDPPQVDLELLGSGRRAPSTPRPPASETAATTSRQWLKAKIGNSMPS